MTAAGIAAITELMTEALSRRLKQAEFTSPEQEALLSVLVAASTINELTDNLCAEHRITRAQYNVLRILRGVYPEGHPRSEIACRMLDRAPDITRLLDRLEARRLVRRTRGSEDQRQTVAFITAKGIKLLDAIRPQLDTELNALVGKFSAGECHELSRLCAAIFEGESQEGSR